MPNMPCVKHGTLHFGLIYANSLLERIKLNSLNEPIFSYNVPVLLRERLKMSKNLNGKVALQIFLRDDIWYFSNYW